MANKKYRIKLSEEESTELQGVVSSKAAARKRLRAQVLLCADENHEQGGMKDKEIARAVGVSVPSVERTRCALAEHGLQVAVHGWPVHRKEPRGKLDGWQRLYGLQPAGALARSEGERTCRTARDWAQTIKWLCDEIYPQAERIVLVQDNLNTHTPASLYEAFEPQEALRLKQRIEWHQTPKHGSWLNMAEIEIGVAQRQCLDRRIATQEEVESELLACTAERNAQNYFTDWRFTTGDARIKLKRLYPSALLK